MRNIRKNRLFRRAVAALLSAAMVVTGIPASNAIKTSKKAEAASTTTRTGVLFNDGTNYYALEFEKPKYYGQSVDFKLVKRPINGTNWTNVTNEFGDDYYLDFYVSGNNGATEYSYDTTNDMILDSFSSEKVNGIYVYVSGLESSNNLYISSSSTTRYNLQNAVTATTLDLSSDDLACPVESINYKGSEGEVVTVNDSFVKQNFKYLSSVKEGNFTVKYEGEDTKYTLNDNINDTCAISVYKNSLKVCSEFVPLNINVEEDYDTFTKLISDDSYDYYVAYKKNNIIGEEFKNNIVYVDKGQKITSDNYIITDSLPFAYSAMLQTSTGDASGINLVNNHSINPYEFSKDVDDVDYPEYSQVDADYVLDVGENRYVVSVENDDEVISTAKIKVNWELPGSYDDSAQADIHQQNSNYTTLKYDMWTPGYSLYSWNNTITAFGLTKNNVSDEDSSWKKLADLSTGSNYVRLEAPNNTYRYFMVNSELSVNIDGDTYVIGYGHRNDYNVSGVRQYPVSFYSQSNGSYTTSADVSEYTDKDADSYTFSPEVAVIDGYDVKYQWSKYERGNGYVDIEGATSREYTAERSDDISIFGEYKLIAEAYIAGTDNKVSSATYSVLLSYDVFDQYYKVKTDSTWNSHYQTVDYYRGIGETVDAKLNLDTTLEDGYKLTYKWYKGIPCTSSNEYDNTSSLYSGGENDRCWYGFEDMNISKNSLSYKLTAKDFSLDDNGTIYYRDCYLRLYVIIEGPDDFELKRAFTIRVHEDPHVFSKVYSDDESGMNVDFDGENPLTINAPKFDLLPDYDVEYTWYEYNNSEKKIDGVTGRTLTVEPEDVVSSYYCKATLIKKDTKYNVFDFAANYSEKYYYYVNYTSKTEFDLDVYRTTDKELQAKYGENVNMGVKSSIETNIEGLKTEYVWYHDGKVIEGENSSSLSLKSVGAEDFGKYNCIVQVIDGDENIVSQKVVPFTLTAVYDVEVLTPSYSYVYNKKIGDTVDLKVDVKNESSKKVEYQWYKYSYASEYHDYYSAYGDTNTTSTYEKIDGATSPNYSFTIEDEDDYGYYSCTVKSGDMYDSIEVEVVNNSYGTYAEVKGTNSSSANYYKKVGDSVDFVVDAGADDSSVKAEYKWFTTSNYDEDMTSVIKGETSNTLSIKNITENLFGKKYQCVVRFKKGDTYIGEEQYLSFYLYEDVEEDETSFEIINEYGASSNAYNRVGDEVRFGVEATTNKKLIYEWSFAKEYFDNNGYRQYTVDFPEKLSETGSVISIDSLKENQFGIYYLNVYSEDEDGQKTDEASYEFTVKRYIGNTIINRTLNGDYSYTFKRAVGESVKFTAVASTDLDEKITYQWYKGSNAINGATSDVYSIDEICRDDFDSYSCTARCNGKTETVYFNLVRTANLKVESNLYSESEEESYFWKYSRGYGEDITFSVNASSDAEYPITYKWYLINGYDWEDESDAKEYINSKNELKATSSEFTLKDIDVDDFGTYVCAVSNGVDLVYCVYELHHESNRFLCFYKDENAAYNENVYINSDGSTKNERIYADLNEEVVFDATAIASEGEAITYEWYKYDEIQKRYILIEGETSNKLSTVSFTDYEDSTVKYNCVVKTSYAEIHYHGEVYLKDVVEITSSVDEYGFAMEGSTVKFSAKVRSDYKDVSYQWYTYDDDRNLVAIDGATGSEVELTAPKVERVDKNNPYAKKNCTRYNYVLCKVSRGQEDSYFCSEDSIGYQSLMKPDTFKEHPKALLENGEDIQAINVPGASMLHIEFSDEYELGGIYSRLFIIKENGEILAYPNEDKDDVAGESLDIEGSTVYLYYRPTYFEPYYEEEDDDSGFIFGSDYLENFVKLTSKNKHGYEVVYAKDKTTYDAEKAAEAEAIAAAAREQAIKDQMLKEAYENALKALNRTYAYGTTGSGVVKNGLLTVNKGEVVVAPGKSIKIKYSAYDDNLNRVKASIASAPAIDSSVASASVVNEKVIKIKVPKKAVRGSVTYVPIVNGKDVIHIKVSVTNKIKKLTPKVKKLKVKKNKAVKVMFNVTAQNKANPTTDLIKKVKASLSKAKLGKIKKVKFNKTKKMIIVKVKTTKKKGKAKLKLQYSKKIKATTKLIIK